MKTTCLLSTCLLLALPAHGGPAHVHGQGELDVTIDKGQISLHLELPLEAAIGFEHAPKNDKEKALLSAAVKTLNEAHTLFIPSHAAQCGVQSVKVSMPEYDGKHADIDADYLFSCGSPDSLKAIETTIFKNFKRLYRIEARRSGPSNQGKMRLTPKQPVLTW